MKSLKLFPFFVGGVALFGAIGSVSAQSVPAPSGYVQDSRGNAVKNSYGQCWRTSSWAPALATRECDPSLMAKPEPVAIVQPSPALVMMAPAPAVTWETLVTEKPVRLDAASFAVGSSELQRGDIAGLDEVVKTAKNHPEIIFVVEGYTSSPGSEKMNQRLSEERASSVKRYLVRKDVDARRITTIGFGEAMPIADNSTLKGREDNRRVEIRYTVTEETRQRLTQR